MGKGDDKGEEGANEVDYSADHRSVFVSGLPPQWGGEKLCAAFKAAHGEDIVEAADVRYHRAEDTAHNGGRAALALSHLQTQKRGLHPDALLWMQES